MKPPWFSSVQTTLSRNTAINALWLVSLRRGFFGTRNMGFLHQQLVEILSYALVLTENHIFTSGATGTNAAVIRGRAISHSPAGCQISYMDHTGLSSTERVFYHTPY
jgi:hypothetical protein